MLADGGELALIDVREELIFSQSHLLLARSAPLSRLELRFPALVPRKSTRIVLVDDADGLAERAAVVLASAGYTDLSVLAGGVSAWAAAGLELFSGVNVPSKAFGEVVEHASRTPGIAAEELDRLLHAGADLVVLDSRPFDEYRRVSIPTAINVPGAELVLRVRDIAPRPQTLVVVNCAGRTRSIIGAQSLINAGVPNRVVALRNGTMGWSLAGLSCESGSSRRAPAVSPAGLAWAKAAAAAVARRCGVACIDRAMLERWQRDETRTTYLFDVRDPAEYAAGHVPGAVSAPGGQLVQATDQFVGTLRARFVLVDDAEVRAMMTASWLRQMGWKDVAVLVEQGSEVGRSLGGAASALPLSQPPAAAQIECSRLADLLAGGSVTVLDVSLSRNYREGHIAGAWFAIRSRLARALAKISLRGTLVLSSEDGVLAGLAVAEAAALAGAPVRWLGGGNEAWRASGRPLVAEPQLLADEPVDVWLKPYERSKDTSQAMREYLAWEIDLNERIRRDGTTDFEPLRN
jgi:rhodanese-related sulfurtransferase